MIEVSDYGLGYGPEYASVVIEHFEHPRHSGRLEGVAVLEGRAGSRREGTEIDFTVRVAAGRVAEARFQAYGCPHTIAAASWVAAQLVGRSRDELAKWSWREVAAALAVPTEKYGRLLILEDALQVILQRWAAEPV